MIKLLYTNEHYLSRSKEMYVNCCVNDNEPSLADIMDAIRIIKSFVGFSSPKTSLDVLLLKQYESILVKGRAFTPIEELIRLYHVPEADQTEVSTECPDSSGIPLMYKPDPISSEASRNVTIKFLKATNSKTIREAFIKMPYNTIENIKYSMGIIYLALIQHENDSKQENPWYDRTKMQNN